MLARDISFLLAAILAVAFLGSLVAYKREDVSWLTFFLAGPMTVINPSRYFRSQTSRVPPTLFALAMLMFCVAWFASWYVDN